MLHPAQFDSSITAMLYDAVHDSSTSGNLSHYDLTSQFQGHTTPTRSRQPTRRHSASAVEGAVSITFPNNQNNSMGDETEGLPATGVTVSLNSCPPLRDITNQVPKAMATLIGGKAVVSLAR